MALFTWKYEEKGFRKSGLKRKVVLGLGVCYIYRNYTKGEGRTWGKKSSEVRVQHVLTFSPWWFLLSRSEDCHDSTSVEPHHPFFWCLGQKIAMTAPVLNSIIPGPGPACANNFTMSFFVSPKEGQPPQPSDPEVALTSLPKLRVYVR